MPKCYEKGGNKASRGGYDPSQIRTSPDLSLVKIKNGLARGHLTKNKGSSGLALMKNGLVWFDSSSQLIDN